MNKKINWRNFISIYIAISFIIMVISGIILYIAPPGRIANWSYWAILGLTKKDWQSIHIIFTFIFVLAGGFHIFYNWKPLMFYLRTKKNSFGVLRYELILAASAGLLIFIFTVNQLPPFNFVIELGETLTDSWENETNSPPASHIEQLTFAELSKSFNIPYNKIESNFRNSNIKFNGFDNSLEEIAIQNNITPQQLFSILNSEREVNPNSANSSMGLGRRTVNDICVAENLELSVVLNRLLINKIEADGASKLKDIANKNKLLPIEIYDMIIQNEVSK